MASYFRSTFPVFFLLPLAIFPSPAGSQESPYIVAYDHYLEEPGNLEVEYFSTFGTQRGGHDFHAFWAEFEYGASAWWTTEVYVDGQTTFRDSTLFTGFRWENRFRPLKHEHFINPILYVEYENKSGADKILKEVEGLDVESDFLAPNGEARKDHGHELEFKLILSSTVKGWNFTENTMARKISRTIPGSLGTRLARAARWRCKPRRKRCISAGKTSVPEWRCTGASATATISVCRNTSHYVAPVAAWNPPSGWTLRLSPGFGLNDNSHRFLMRWGVSREFPGFGEMIGHLFGGRR